MIGVVWSDPGKNLTLHASGVAPAELADLLSRTEWGTREVTYGIRGVDRILERIKDPYFLLLKKTDSLVGAVVASRKSVSGGAKSYDALFIAMIAVDPTMIGSGYGVSAGAKIPQ